MGKSRSDKISVFFATLLFAGASLISLRYIGNISADIENGAATSPLKLTDFSAVRDFSESSWISFSNIGDESPPIEDDSLKITNDDAIYQNMLAQPLMLSVDKKYKIYIKYKIDSLEDFSVKYGFVAENIIGKPIFTHSLDSTKQETILKYTNKIATPLTFQYFKSTGKGQFALREVRIEEILEEQALTPTPSPEKSSTPEKTVSPNKDQSPRATNSQAEPLEKISIKQGWNPFGYNKPIDTASFTSSGLSVYSVGLSGWIVAKPNNKDSDFSIEAGKAVYVLNESGRAIDVSLFPATDEAKSELKAGWNILFSAEPTNPNDRRVKFEGEEKSLADLIKESKASKYIYSVDPAKPNDLIKINLEKYPKLGAGQVLWIYLF